MERRGRMGLEKEIDTAIKMIDEIQKHNHRFVQEKGYETYLTDKYPKKRLAILTCMDTRLTELLPAALGIKNGDAKIIRNAGGIICNPYGSEIKSLLVSILQLDVNIVMVIGHTDCGMEKLNSDEMLEKLQERKIRKETMEELIQRGFDLHQWISGIESTEEAVRSTVLLLKKHPLIPKDVYITGFIMETRTGSLIEVGSMGSEEKER